MSLQQACLSFSMAKIVRFFEIKRYFFRKNLANVPANVPNFCKRFKYYSPVDSLHCIVVFSTTCLSSISGLLIFSITSSAAFLPISSSGGSMVVICGDTMVDSSVPEKPATKISSGTRLPKARSRFCAPIAKVSVKAKTASKRWKISSKCYLYITFYNISYPFLKWKRLQQSSTLFFYTSFFAVSIKSCTFASEFQR